MLFYLIYTSKAKKLMLSDELIVLLEQSRRNNLTFDITGMLLYMESRFLAKQEGRFMQVLEGTEKNVLHIYDLIVRDERHHAILLLQTGSMDQRSFEGWSMGFRAFTESEYSTTPGYVMLNDDLFESGKEERSPLQFLKSFYDLNNI